MTTIASQCVFCIHYRRTDKSSTCDAFPKGIPEPVLLNQVDHRQPIEGDHGVQWEPDGNFTHPLEDQT